MKSKTKNLAILFALLLNFSLVISNIPTKEVFADAGTIDIATQRTILWNFSDCIVRYGDRASSIIDTRRGHFGESKEDAAGDWMDDKNYVVGFDVDPINGVVSCLDIIQKGINTLIDRGVSIPQNNGAIDVAGTAGNDAAQKASITEWLSKYVINKNFAELNGKKSNYNRADFEAKLRALKAMSDAELAKIGPLTKQMIQRRYFKLVNICFTSSSTSNGAALDTGKGDFTYGGKFYYIKNRSEMKPAILSFVTDGGDTNLPGDSHVFRLDAFGGAAGLGFHSFLGDNGVWDDTPFTPYSSDGGGSDFYPMGTDVPTFTEAGNNKGMADCGRIIQNESIKEAVLGTGIQIVRGEIAYTADNPNSAIANSGPANSAGPNEETDTCESSGFSLGWITCGLINGMSSMVQKVFTGIIEPYLKTAPIDTTASTDNPIFKVWSSIRNIANIVLIFALLFVVFGQAIGGGLIDAYTAKKIMPRLLAAAILINISIYLVAALIDIFNVLGAGIGDLILGPFKNTIFSKFHNNGTGNAIGIGAIIAGVVVAVLAVIVTKGFKADIAGGTKAGASLGATFVPFLHFMLVFVLIPAVLISLAIFATLIIRQGIILILVVTAPIAFAFFAIPSTEKYFKKWWDTLISTLMVYPIMTVIFSASIILAALSFSVGDRTDATGSNIIGAIVAFVILIVPLALIPFSFKLAGGIIGNLLNVTKGLGDKAGGIGKNRYKEGRSFDRKLEHDRKFQSPTGTMQKRRDIKEAHRSRSAAAFKNASAAVFNDASKDAGVGAYESTESYSPAQRELARTTAINTHKTLTAAADAMPPGSRPTKEAINAGAVSAGIAAANNHTPEAVQAAATAAMTSYDRLPPATAANESMAMGGAAAHIHKQTLARTGSAAIADIESRDVNNLNVALNAYDRNTSKGEDQANTAAQAAAEAYSRKDPLRPISDIDAIDIGSDAADLHVTTGDRDYALDTIRTTY
ncbi:MAG: hypothetical protein WCJ60_02665 [bacterium]